MCRLKNAVKRASNWIAARGRFCCLKPGCEADSGRSMKERIRSCFGGLIDLFTDFINDIRYYLSPTWGETRRWWFYLVGWTLVIYVYYRLFNFIAGKNIFRLDLREDVFVLGLVFSSLGVLILLANFGLRILFRIKTFEKDEKFVRADSLGSSVLILNAFVVLIVALLNYAEPTGERARPIWEAFISVVNFFGLSDGLTISSYISGTGFGLTDLLYSVGTSWVVSFLISIIAFKKLPAFSVSYLLSAACINLSLQDRVLVLLPERWLTHGARIVLIVPFAIILLGIALDFLGWRIKPEFYKGLGDWYDKKFQLAKKIVYFAADKVFALNLLIPKKYAVFINKLIERRGL